jgi:C-terminal processing protease CtpA/Prc
MSHLMALPDGAGMIVDLRGADGADLDAAVILASPFHCPGDVLLRVESLAGTTLESCMAVTGTPLRMPLMALIDRDTRGAAETLAALWSGREGVMLIGEPTRGDARLRELLPMPDGRFLQIATKRIVPVSGTYEAKGVHPDVLVDVRTSRETPLVYVAGRGRPLSEKSLDDRDLMMRVDGDPVLRRGTDLLLALRALNDHVRR